MRYSKTLLEEIGVIAMCLFIIAIYTFSVLCSWSWTSVITPILAALIIGGFLRVRTFLYLRGINGEYEQYDLDENPLPDKSTSIEFGWRNLLRIRPSFFVMQKSDSKGDWESIINISGQNPLISSGMYKYTKSGNSGGGKKGDWGIHELHINPEDWIIHVKAVSKGRQGADEYILKKVNL